MTGGRPGMISAATGAMALVVVPLVEEHGVSYLFAATILAGVLQIGLGKLGVGSVMRAAPSPLVAIVLLAVAAITMGLEPPTVDARVGCLPAHPHSGPRRPRGADPDGSTRRRDGHCCCVNLQLEGRQAGDTSHRASANDLDHSFDFDAVRVKRVEIDLTDARIWDTSAVAALDTVVAKFADRGIHAELVGLNRHAEELHSSTTGKVKHEH